MIHVCRITLNTVQYKSQLDCVIIEDQIFNFNIMALSLNVCSH